MSVGEILDTTFSLLRRHFGELFAIVLATAGPGRALTLYVTVASGSAGFLDHPLLLLCAWLLSGIGGILASAAMLKAVSDDYLGQPGDVRDALAFSFGKFWSLLAAGAARGILVGLATLLLIVPGIIVACGYAVVTQVVVLENLPRSMDALGRSWELTRGHRNRALGVGVVAFVITLVPGMALGVLSLFGATAQVVAQVLAAALQLALVPVIGCAFTLFYYDLRIRKEALDLEILSRQLTAASS